MTDALDRVTAMEERAMARFERSRALRAQAEAQATANEARVCFGCAEAIAPARLKALPITVLCLACAEQHERTMALRGAR